MIVLRDKVALVSGGSRGIGRACCEALAGAGARVAVNYRVERARAEQLVQELEQRGAQAFSLAADIAVRDEAEMMVDETVAHFGGLDILINNAGIWKGAPIEEISDGEWTEMVGTNLTGTFHLLRAAVPHLRARQGRIVNIASTAGQRGEAGHSHYAATKGAIISLTKSLASELGPSGVRTNCVAPGWVDTDMTHEALSGPDQQRIVMEIPLGRVGRAEEIAAAVLFLVSDMASFVNGEVLNVNGGSVLVG